MKSKGLIIGIVSVLAVAAIVLLVKNSNQQPNDNSNPYELNYQDFKQVDEALIGYKETLRFKISGVAPRAMGIRNNTIYLAIDKSVDVISLKGELIKKIDLNDIPKALGFLNDQLLVAFKDYYIILEEGGTVIFKSESLNEKAEITSILAQEDRILVADAGNRVVYAFGVDGTLLAKTQGKRNEDDLHGFIIPSPYFDMCLDPSGELWVVNPGRHALEHYDNDLNYRANWEKASFKLEGFSGCCNPAQMTILTDGSFLTSEKGLVRLKIYAPNGDLKTVVAPPSKFKDEGHAPDVSYDDEGRIYALDFDTNTIRVFEEKQ